VEKRWANNRPIFRGVNWDDCGCHWDCSIAYMNFKSLETVVKKAGKYDEYSSYKYGYLGVD
jgi:hypothetical protein